MPLTATARSMVRRVKTGAGRLAIDLGLPPASIGLQFVRQETPHEHVLRVRSGTELASSCELIHPEAVARNPLPFNIADRSALPDEKGWWGYSMRDVPERRSAPTYLARIADAKVITCRDERGEFYPAILTSDNRALNLREIVLRPMHAKVLRGDPPIRRLKRAVWFCERVYDNHSHWLTAHLPKLCLLRDRGELEHVLLPEQLTPAMQATLRMLDLDPAAFPTFRIGEVLQVEELTAVVTDRFRAELLRPVRDALAPPGRATANRRIYISRAKAARRRLANEAEVWPLFEQAGFERVFMEELGFAEQVQLMAETQVLAAPHGAGLTNMIFCPPGAHVVEIAWLGFPNPNFYALASAMDLGYGLVPAQECGGAADPLQRDMTVQPAAVRDILAMLEERLAT